MRVSKTRTLQISGQAPLEAGQQALLHALQVNRGAVRSQDDLLALLVQVVENLKERRPEFSPCH